MVLHTLHCFELLAFFNERFMQLHDLLKGLYLRGCSLGTNMEIRHLYYHAVLISEINESSK